MLVLQNVITLSTNFRYFIKRTQRQKQTTCSVHEKIFLIQIEREVFRIGKLFTTRLSVTARGVTVHQFLMNPQYTLDGSDALIWMESTEYNYTQYVLRLMNATHNQIHIREFHPENISNGKLLAGLAYAGRANLVDQPASFKSRNRVPKSRPSSSGPWDLNSEKIWTVVNEEGQIIFWSHLACALNYTYDGW